MVNALKEGALFSENTWLIHPASYFGYYPFSYTPIGVPMFLTFLITLLNFISWGIFGLAEAILVFNIIIIVFIYKSSRNLGNKLFEEEWSRFVFVAAILFFPYLIRENTNLNKTNYCKLQKINYHFKIFGDNFSYLPFYI